MCSESSVNEPTVDSVSTGSSGKEGKIETVVGADSVIFSNTEVAQLDIGTFSSSNTMSEGGITGCFNGTDFFGGMRGSSVEPDIS